MTGYQILFALATIAFWLLLGPTRPKFKEGDKIQYFDSFGDPDTEIMTVKKTNGHEYKLLFESGRAMVLSIEYVNSHYKKVENVT